jgi:DNA-binding LacI/PurR family transcriptional regulator
VTLADVAARAGVSVMTASYAFNRPERVSESARAKVADSARALGYVGPDPNARSLRRRSTSSVGVVLGEHLSYAFDDPQAAAFLAGIADVCAERSYALTILPATGGPEDAQRIRVAAVDGFVIWTTVDDDPVLTTVRALRAPAVIHGGPMVEGLGLVSVDSRAAAREIAALTFAGATRPAVLAFPLDQRREEQVTPGLRPGTATFPVTRDRLLGFRDGARRAGHGWSSVTVAVCSHNDRAHARAMTERLLAGPVAPDAIAAMGDEQAFGALEALRAAGLRVPADVAVSGWDDSAEAAVAGLTTIAQSMRDQGAECARMILDDAPRHLAASWTLERRRTTRAAP